MPTVIRPEVTKKSEYYISKERYYELKHFCLQYNEWKLYCNSLSSCVQSRLGYIKGSTPLDPVSTVAQQRERYTNYITMVDQAAKDTDPVLGKYIFEGVIYGLPYEKLNARIRVPCCKGSYYILYRRFFWILSRLRDG